MVRTPDFAEHPWIGLESAVLGDGIVQVAWADGTHLACHPLWLYEQTVGIEPRTREGTIEPGMLPDFSVITDANVDVEGALSVTWTDGSQARVHPGWLRHVALDEHLPSAAVGESQTWTVATFDELPTFDGRRVLDDSSVLEAWLSSLCTLGVGRLRGAPATDEFMGDLARAVGPIRASNFGGVFTVESVVEPDSTANTGLALGQHTDLPTRETPPGFQFLHCVENTVAGGFSRLADGLAVVEELRRNHPDEYGSLTTDEWVFANRAIDGDHRWVGPIIEPACAGRPLTLRAFYPVRLAPRMPIERQSAAYAAMRVFSQVAHDPRFMISSAFEPGDLIGFDNRRVLHGRDGFDAGEGRRRLRGCYIDHDDVFSRLRVLRRPRSSISEPAERNPS